MKNIAYIILILLISVLGIVGIYFLINPTENDNIPQTTKLQETEEGYNLITKEENFETYLINRNLNKDFNIIINDNKIEYQDKELIINGIDIIASIKLNNALAIYYNRNIVLSFSYLNDYKDGFIIFDSYDNTYELFDHEDNYFIEINDNLDFLKNSFIYNLSMVIKDKIIVNNQSHNICKFNYAKTGIVRMAKEYIYDFNLKKFHDSEILTSLDYESYININKWCD